MSTFIEKLANARSLANRRLVYGVGVNDAWYKTEYKSACGGEDVVPLLYTLD